MKKLMTMMAALVTGLCVWADSGAALKNTFDASTATASDWTTGWSGDALTNNKVTFDDDKNVLVLTSGVDRLTRNVNDGSVYAIGDEGAFFDVHMDALCQALDEIPTLPDGARFALFFFDATEAENKSDYTPTGVGLYAIAGDPSAVGTGRLLLYFGTADTSSATTEGGKAVRFTIKNYGNVLKSSVGTSCPGYMIYQDKDDASYSSGGERPLQITKAFPITGTTVDWANPVNIGTVYTANKFLDLVKANMDRIALSIVDGDPTVTALDFQGNANISKVVMSNDATKFPFIGKDVATGSLNIGDGLAVTVIDASQNSTEYTEAKIVTLTGNATIYAKATGTEKPVVKVTADDSVLTEVSDGLPTGYTHGWSYNYGSGADVTISAVAAGVSVTIDGTTSSYETLADALSALSTAENTASVTLLNDATLALTTDENGYITLAGSDVTIDLNGKTLTGTKAEGVEANCLFFINGGATTIKDTVGGGRIVSADVPAIYLASGSLVTEGDFYVDGAVTVHSDWSASAKQSITLSGGSYLASANSTEGDTPAFTHAAYLAKGKAATKQTIGEVDYWVVGEQTTVQYTVTFVTPDPTGSADPTTSEVKVEENTTVTEVTPTAVEGWTFLGWYVTEDGKVSEEKFDFTTPIMANITLTAKWSNWATVLGDADTDGAYKIDDETDLKAFAANVGVLPTVGVSFKLTGSIALTEKWAGIGVYDKDKNASVFEGTFDGGNFTISNVVFADNASGNNYRGFFNQIYKATVKNLTVDGSGFGTDVPSGEYGCALVVGCANDSTIENCTAIGTIASGTHNVAGIVVRIKDSTVKGCTNKAALTCSYSKIGGIAAICQYSTTGCVIENCVNEGTLTADDDAAKAGVDGLAGILAYTCDGDASVTIKGCSNKGSLVKGDNASANANVGQIIGYAYRAITVDGANTGLADVVSVGKSGVGVIDGLTFATVDEEGTTATFVKNDALELAGTYKVMASGAAYTMTALGSITFDTSLATVSVTQGGGYASEDDYSLTEAKDTTNEKVITYTLAKKATTPTLDPTKDPVVVKTEDAADKLEITVTVPTEVASTVTKETYTGYFKKSVTKLTDGDGSVTGYSVAAVLNEEVIVPDDVAAEIAGAFDTITEDSVAVTKAKPGLYYSVEQGQTLDNMTEGDRVMAKSASVDIPATKYEGSGFYRVRVSVTDKQ